MSIVCVGIVKICSKASFPTLFSDEKSQKAHWARLPFPTLVQSNPAGQRFVAEEGCCLSINLFLPVTSAKAQ